ncbi:unnamed protein product [Danaus chrysippus]|uniref:(African queen) hypothetical protein n=1 Tax=Danaus chrysippus TaxID=151541 RepID=A0A8J2QCU2_9NEOP|nr:unnamed protein product [Danaus chrysippus]
MLSERAWRERGRGYGVSGSGTTTPEHRRGPNAATWSYGGRARSGGGGGGAEEGCERGCATLSRRAGNAARGGRPRGGTGRGGEVRQPPAAGRQPPASVTFDGGWSGRRTVGRSDVAVGTRAARLSC